MPIKPTDAKKLAQMFNTMDLKSMINANDELMRMVMEAGDFATAEEAAQAAAEYSAALIVRKNDVRELAKRVRDRVSEEGEPQTDQPAAQASEPATPASTTTEETTTEEASGDKAE